METRDHLHVKHGADGSGRRVGHPPAASWSPHAGWFRLSYDDDRWVWSPRVEQMHGYLPGTVAPSTLLVLSHVHPDDSRQVTAALDDVRLTHHSFSSCHRIVDTDSEVHDVVMVGAPFFDAHGKLAGMQGLYLDLTWATSSSVRQDGRAQATHRLRALAAGSGHTEDRRERIRAATRC